MMMRSRVVEELRQRITNFVEARPVQVAQDKALFGFALGRFDQSKLLVEITPVFAVENEPVYPRPKLRIHRIMQIALPPKVKREIRLEMREDDVRKKIRTCTF